MIGMGGWRLLEACLPSHATPRRRPPPGKVRAGPAHSQVGGEAWEEEWREGVARPTRFQTWMSGLPGKQEAHCLSNQHTTT